MALKANLFLSGASLRQAKCLMLVCVAVAIPAAFMMSVKIYKIWYIVTAFCGVAVAVTSIRENDRWLVAQNFFRDGVGVFVYCAAMLASGLHNLTPQSSYALLVDTIYPVVFAIFYYVGLKSPAERITKAMRFLIWPALLSFVIFWNEDAIRQGYRVIQIIPFVAPFMVLALYQGSLLAGFELGATIVLLIISMSRAPLGGAIVGTGVSLIMMAKSARGFAFTTGQAAAWTLALFTCAHNVSFINVKMNETAERIRAASLTRSILMETRPVSAAEAQRNPPSEYNDLERAYIDRLYWKLLPTAGPLGIGYGNFINHYRQEYPGYDGLGLHNVYQAWTLEGGAIGALAALYMIGVFARAMLRGYRTSPNLDQRQFILAISISMLSILAAAVFHQMHQGPMLYAIMGLGLGASRAITLRQPSN